MSCEKRRGVPKDDVRDGFLPILVNMWPLGAVCTTFFGGL